MEPGGAAPARSLCSRAGCRRPADYRLEWRNPRIHGADRTKVWLACEEHQDELAAFLTARAFPLVVRPLAGDSGSDAASRSGGG